MRRDCVLSGDQEIQAASDRVVSVSGGTDSDSAVSVSAGEADVFFAAVPAGAVSAVHD